MADQKIHAQLGASSAHRWMACPGSVRLERGLPGRETKASQEGTEAHALAEKALLHGYGVFDDVAPDMAEPVRIFVDYCDALRYRPGAVFWIEQRFDLEKLNPPEPMFGTADFMALDAEIHQLEIVDLKFGRGVVVEVADNKQLKMYALGGLLSIDTRHRVDTIKITIIQPRVEHADGMIRSEVFTLDDLIQFSNELMDAARATQDPNAPLIPGKQCRFCKASGNCPAQYAAAQSTAMVEFGAMPLDVPPNPDTLPDSVLHDMLPKLDVLKTWIKAMESRAERDLLEGKEVPGFKLVARRANRKWIDEGLVSDRLMDKGFVPEEIQDVSLKSVSQLERAVGKKNIDPTWYEKKSSGHVMVPVSDPRAELKREPGDDFGLLEAGDTAEE